MTRKAGTFKEFRKHTIAIVKGKRGLAANEPKAWYEPTEPGRRRPVRFSSLEAGAKLLSAKNRALLRTIATQRPRSVSELATLTGRAEQNVLRTLRKLSAAGLVRLDRGVGRAYRPVVSARKVYFEIDLLR
jgi:predicted transcriptional regulator